MKDIQQITDEPKVLLSKDFPLIACVSPSAEKFSLVENSVLLFDSSIKTKELITKIDATPIIDQSSESSVTRLFNQIKPATNILILDIDPGSEIDSSKFPSIISYLEDVFIEIDVIIMVAPDNFLRETFDKVIKSKKTPKNFYHLLPENPEAIHLLNIFTNQFKRNNETLKIKGELEDMLHERNELYKYFSEDVIQEIMGSDKESKKSASRVSTIMFLDIRNFTGISEKLEPQQVVELLDLLFTDIVDLIFSNKGSVNKFIGDAILATFGCPKSYGNDRENAVRCAMNLISALSIFNEVKPDFLTDDISLGIGIATGKVFAGNVGSHRKMEYTVIGDTVNLASRLQEMTKKLSCKLIVDSATYEGMESKIPFEITDIHNVRGKKQNLDIYYLPDKYFDSI